jgi:prepilin-type N-terminal cleavage/methylation domain-containing protein
MRTLKAGIWTERGFSLIELTVVLCIIGLVVGLLALSLFRGRGLAESARSVTGAVREAYVQAVVSREARRLCLSVERGEYWISPVSCTDRTRDTRRAQLPPMVRFTGVETEREGSLHGTDATIMFFPIGLAERSTIRLEDNSHSELRLMIHPLTGLVSVSTGDEEAQAAFP